ncbi:tetratricopeptide repeat protein [Marinobacter sp.]|uniref:tetratricopeptide repeat protein n=1 Tax=Marinobacter sp. TaxID=50741 RepID=UPI003A9370DE
MNWDKNLSATLLLLLLLSGCALGPGGVDTLENKDALKESEAHLQAAFAEAVVLMQNGDTDEAGARFEQMAAQYPQRPGPIANLGLLAFQAGDMELARNRFEQVLSIDPAHPVALNHLGVIARMTGDFPAAERHYRKALAAHPEYLPAILNLAFLLDIYLGEPAKALLLYEQYKTLAEDPDPGLKDWMFDAKNRI